MDHSSHTSHPHVNYFGVFIALCICTLLSVGFDGLIKSPALLVSLVLAVAVAKAAFVMTYFMHLKFEGNWKFIILMPTAILGVGLMVALAPDMALRYYSSLAPQAEWLRNAPKHEESHGAEPHGAPAAHPEGAAH